VTSLEDNARRLLEVAPAEYVTERTRLVKQARGQGDKVGAKELAALVRPNLALWAVLAAGRDELAVRRLHRTTSELARVQASGAGHAALSAATDARRRELDGLVRAAVDALAAFEPTATVRRTEIRQIVEQLSRHEDVADDWVSGVLRDVPADLLGFSAFADLDPPVLPSRDRGARPTSPSVSPKPAEPAAPAAADAERAAAARVAAEQARACKQRAEADLADAERRLGQADERVAKARQAVERAQAALDRAENDRATAAQRHGAALDAVGLDLG
jgi:hypothetical protein